MASKRVKAERAHAQRRALERYGLVCGRHTRQVIIAAITGGKGASFVRRSSLRVSIFDVQIEDGPLVRVAYDRKRKELVTFLPLPAPELPKA